MNLYDEYSGPTKSGWLVILFGTILIILAVIVISSIKTIQPGEAAVATKFGELNGVRNEGMYLALFEGYTIYDLKAKRIDGHHEAGSKNGQFIFVDAAFSYNLESTKLQQLFSEVGSQTDVEQKFIHPVLADVIKEVTAQYSADEILPKQAEFRLAIENAIKERMNQEYIIIGDLQITNIDFTAEYNQAIELKQIAQQDAQKAQYKLDQTKVEAQAQVVQAQAQADAQKLLQQTLTPEILQKLYFEKWNGVLPTTLTGSDSSFLLPLK